MLPMCDSKPSGRKFRGRATIVRQPCGCACFRARSESRRPDLPGGACDHCATAARRGEWRRKYYFGIISNLGYYGSPCVLQAGSRGVLLHTSCWGRSAPYLSQNTVILVDSTSPPGPDLVLPLCDRVSEPGRVVVS